MKVNSNSIFINKRVVNTSNSSLGILYLDTTPIAFIIEDEPREIKVKGETRIPAGTYKLGLRKETTPLTIKYRKKFDWFKYHIELLNVPNFTGIYIHIGNYESNTEGCQLINAKAYINKGEFEGQESTKEFKEFYLAVYPLLEQGANIYYKIIDNV